MAIKRNGMIKEKKLKNLLIMFVAVLAVFTIGGTITFARYYNDFEKNTESVKIADAIAKIEVNSVYRRDSDNNRISTAFDKNSNTIMLYDVEPEDEIEYYFTVVGTEGKRANEVTMNATLSVAVRLETISTDGSGKQADYFAGWKQYTTDDGVKDGGYLRIYHGSETDSEKDIRPSSSGQNETVDFTGNSLSIISVDNSIINKTGLVMRADDGKKEYPYHLKFKLPKQNSEKENYAGARVYFDIQIFAEQAKF